MSDDSISDDPRPREDEMDPDQYQYPPGLMPSAESTYASIKDDDGVIIYQTDGERDCYLKSDISIYLLN